MEAEEGVIHSLGLEASHAGFGGWGYLAGWNADGQWVDFQVETTGASSLSIRYAAGAGTASRLIYIDGVNVVADQPFAATTTWDGWATLTVPVALAAGAHTISIIYNRGLGSTGFLNVDWIELAP